MNVEHLERVKEKLLRNYFTLAFALMATATLERTKDLKGRETFQKHFGNINILGTKASVEKHFGNIDLKLFTQLA